uniref:C1q domain-containing protein n=1 Tax=Magallana gigas TaxID=29159 RepID=A0A8W8L3G2_MAGGI
MSSLITSLVLLCTVFYGNALLFNGPQSNATSTSISNGQMDPAVQQQLQKMQTVLDSALKDLAALQQENRLLLQQQQIYELKQKLSEQQHSALELQVQSLKEDVQMLKTLNQTSQQRIVLLEDSLHHVQSENQILRDDLDELNVTSQTGFQELRIESHITNEIVRKIKIQDREITKNVSASLQSQQLQMQHLSLSLLDMQNLTSVLSSRVDDQQNQIKLEIQRLTNSLDATTTKFNASLSHIAKSHGPYVAFTAGFSGCCQHTFAVGQPVRYNLVLYQVGGGYDLSTGIFTAPRAGLYIIYSTVVAQRNEAFWSKIVVNGSIKIGILALDDTNNNLVQSASNLIVQQLQVGDRVWIQLHSGKHLYSAISDNTFSVFMIN